MKRTLLYILTALCLLNASAQTLDTLRLSTIAVVPTQFKNVEEFGSVIVQEPFLTVAELLTNCSSVQVNNQGGKGATSSVSIRGYSSNKTNVKWNGLSINNLTLGMTDFGGIQSGVVDNISVYKGNSVSDLNDVSIGGVIAMDNELNWKDTFHFQIGSEIGSFGYLGNQFKTGGLIKGFTFQVKSSFLSAVNDFKYKNHKRIGTPNEVQENAAYYNGNLIFSTGWRNKKIKLENHTWFSTKKVESPKIFADSKPSVAFYRDSSIRSVFNFYIPIKKVRIKGFYGINHERFLYNDSLFAINTFYVLNNNHFNVSAKHNLKDWYFEYLSEIQFQNAHNNQFEDLKRRVVSLTKSRIEKRLFKERLKISGTGVLNKIWRPNTVFPGGVIAYHFSVRQFVFKGSGGSHFRVGNFDDLFWPKGGDENLKPEKGWNIEQSVGYSVMIKKLKFTLFGEVYNSIVNDWIQWRDAGEYWAVENLKKVNAQGGEASLEVNFSLNEVKLNFMSHYSLTKVTTLESELPNDPSIGNQLTYVPMNKSKNRISLVYKGFTGNYVFNYYSLRHTTTDNVERKALASYYLQDLHLMKKWNVKPFSIYSKFSILNLSNQFYEGVSNRPMPGRSYYFTLLLNFS